MRSKAECTAIFLGRLAAAPSCSSADEAFDLVCRTLDDVEEEFTDTPFDPQAFESDGRLYPPDADSRRETAHPEVARYRSRSHNTFIGTNGAIMIVDLKRSETCLDKAGSDGRTIGVLMATPPSKR